SIAHGEGMLRGRVLDQQQMPLRSAAVVVTWQSNFSIIGSVSGDQVNRTEKTIGALSDDVGGWRLCGVPRYVPLFVSVPTDAGSGGRQTRLVAEFAALDLQLGSGGATRAENALVGAGIVAKRMALVEIAVFNLAGAPVPDATIDVEPTSGPTRRVVS